MGVIEQQIECGTCNNLSSKKEEFVDISINIDS